jgi:Ribosomal protein S7p/S5e
MPILREAILMASPAVRSMIHRRGAKNVVKPVALGEKQRTRFALQWILAASDKKSGQTVEERLAREFIAVLQGTSDALRKKEEVHRFAMVNRSVGFFFFLPVASLDHLFWIQGKRAMAYLIVTTPSSVEVYLLTAETLR